MKSVHWCILSLSLWSVRCLLQCSVSHREGISCKVLLPGIVAVGELVPVCGAWFVFVVLRVPLVVLYGDRFVVDGVEAGWVSEGARLGVL